MQRHQLSDSLLAHPESPGKQLFPYPWPAVFAFHLGVDRSDMHQQRIVAHPLSLLRARAPAKVLVVPARTYPQYFALHRYRPVPFVPLNPGVPHSDSLAKYVAFFKMSRSIFTRESSALSRLISICSALTALDVDMNRVILIDPTIEQVIANGRQH